MTTVAVGYEPGLAARRRVGTLFAGVCFLMTCSGLVFLTILLARVFHQASGWLDWQFVTSLPSELFPEECGALSALMGSLWLILLTALFAVPAGTGAAIYLEEYAAKNRFTRIIETNIANLAGVPSIVYGILGLAVFVRWFRLERSLIAGALTLSLVVLPVVIITAREALAAVPQSVRAASYALGATRWQTIRSHVLPAAIPGIMTGTILAMSRAIGEAAPLITLGALTYVPFTPTSIKDPFTALPIQIYAWTDNPLREFHHLAAAGIIVLLGILLPMNGVAVAVRAWQQRKKRW